MSQIFVNDSAVGAFTIDLADSRYFIQRSGSPGSIVRDNLGGGNQISTTNPAPVTPTFVSFGDVPILYINNGGTFFVLNPTPIIAQGYDGVTALTLYRSVRQPLPGQLTYLYLQLSFFVTNAHVQLCMIFYMVSVSLSQRHQRLLVT